MADIKYDISEALGVISESAKGWTKELNLISWNGGTPKFDIRDWAPENEKMGKGITLGHIHHLWQIELHAEFISNRFYTCIATARHQRKEYQ